MLLHLNDTIWQDFLPWMIAAAGVLLVLLPALAMLLDSRRGGFGFTAGAVLVACAAAWAFGWAMLPLTLLSVGLLALGQVLLRRRIRFFDGLIFSCGAAMAGVAAGMVALYLVYGQNLSDVLADWLRAYLLRFQDSALLDLLLRDISLTLKAAVDSLTSTADLNTAREAIAALSFTQVVDDLLPTLRSYIEWAVPSMMVTLSVYGGVLGWSLPAGRITRRRKKGLPVPGSFARLGDMPPFENWSIPRWVYLPMLLLMLFSIFVRLLGWESMTVASLVISELVYTIMMFQGMAMVWFWLGTRRMDPPVRGLLIGIVFVLVRGLLSWIGLFDMLFSIRKYWTLRRQIMEQLRRDQAPPPPRPDQPKPPTGDNDKEDKDK